MYDDNKAMDLLREELSNKKPFIARYKMRCAVGGCSIEQDDEFYFLGGSKICNNCRAELMDSL